MKPAPRNLILTLALAFVLAACGGGDGNASSSGGDAETGGNTGPGTGGNGGGTGDTDPGDTDPGDTGPGGGVDEPGDGGDTNGGGDTPDDGAPPAGGNGTGTAALDWIPPTQNTDGTELGADLAGYHIYHGTSANGMSRTATIGNPGLTSWVVENLPSGTHYFAVTAYNHAGRESERSTTASKVIP